MSDGLILSGFDGSEVYISPEQAEKIANVAGLIVVKDSLGKTTYWNPKNIASITSHLARLSPDEQKTEHKKQIALKKLGIGQNLIEGGEDER